MGRFSDYDATIGEARDLEMVTYDGYFLERIARQTTEICMVVVKQDRRDL